MNLNEIKSLCVWDVLACKFIPISECPCPVDEMTFSDNYVFLRSHNKVDKKGVLVGEGDILMINPDDDEWYDIVVWKYIDKKGMQKGLELLNYEIGSVGNVDLKMALDRHNPSLIIGHVLTHPELVMKIISGDY